MSSVVSGETEDIPAGSVMLCSLQVVGASWDENCATLVDLSPTAATVNR